MLQHRLLVLALVAGCGSSPPLLRTPSDSGQLTTEKPVDSEPTPAIEHEALEMLETFLQARWSYDAERVVAFVTEDDALHVKELSRQLPPRSHDRGRVGLWHQWRVVEIEERSPGIALATVEVWRPASLQRLGWESKRVDEQLEHLRVLLGDHERFSLLRSRAEDLLLPARRPWMIQYRLVEKPSGWKVHMAWRDYPDFFRTRRSGVRPRPWQEFEASERSLVKRTQEADENRFALSESVSAQNLNSAVRRAEKHLSRRNYRRALEVYEEITLRGEPPEFVLQWAEETAAAQASWSSATRDLQFRVVVGETPVGSPAKVEITVELTNTGPATLSKVSIAFEQVYGRSVSSRVAGVSFDEVAPGSSQTRTFSDFANIRIPHAWIETVKTGSPAQDLAPFPPLPTPEMRWAYQLHRGTGPYPTTWLMDVVVAERFRLQACPAWPDELVRAVVRVDGMGRVTSVDVAPGEPAYVECVAGLLGARLFPAGLEPWAADVQLIPPGYWERARSW